MIIFNTDLDNTIIYSYKQDIGKDKMPVEVYQNREISYITGKTYELLKHLKKEILIVPTSTRTAEQYGRIDLRVGPFPYALVCNGGVLLVNGKPDERWYRESLERISASIPALQDAFKLLEAEGRRTFELRFIENLFLFTKCREPEKVAEGLAERLDGSLVDVCHNGKKVYVVPVGLNKGTAVERFREYAGGDMVLAAGDSELDVSMLKAADIGFAPFGFREKYGMEFDVKEAGKKELFSEYVLNECNKMLKGP